MATTSPAFTVTNADWTLIADGATIATIAAQIDLTTPSVQIAFAASKPAATSNDFIVLQRERDPSFDRDITATDKVYARAPGSAAAIVRTILSGR